MFEQDNALEFFAHCWKHIRDRYREALLDKTNFAVSEVGRLLVSIAIDGDDLRLRILRLSDRSGRVMASVWVTPVLNAKLNGYLAEWKKFPTDDDNMLAYMILV